MTIYKEMSSSQRIPFFKSIFTNEKRIKSPNSDTDETIRLRLQIIENKILVKKVIWSLVSIIMVVRQFNGAETILPPMVRMIALTVYMNVLMTYWLLG